MTRHCPARMCPQEIGDEHFMCARHWFSIPDELRFEVGQHLKQPKHAWLELAKKAIQSVDEPQQQPSAPLRRVIAWSLAKPVPNRALLECGHLVKHQPWEGRDYANNVHLQKILARDQLKELPESKRCRKCGTAEPLFERR